MVREWSQLSSPSVFGVGRSTDQISKNPYTETDTLKNIKDGFRDNIADCLKSIAANTKPETKPWSVRS
jgi:hypothetical protein